MTVPATARKAGPFTGNGVQTVFPFTFKIFATTDVKVVVADAAGVESTLSSGFTTTMNVDQVATPGGSVTLSTALATGYKLALLGNLPYDQTLAIPGGGNYNPVSHENALDRIVEQVQQVAEVGSRVLTLPATASGASTTLPGPAGNKVIGWDAAGTSLVNIDQGSLVTSIAYGTANSDIFSGNGVQTVFVLTNNPGALNNLDVSVGGVAQRPGIDYTWVNGTSVTFTTAPVAGTNNVLVRYMQALALGTASAADVTFSPSGTGAVATTAQTKLRESVSVKDFGVIGDGVTDDSAAFQLAANAAINAGGSLFIPGGDYLIGTTVTLGSPSAYTGGLKVYGVAPNSVGKRSQIIQKDVNIPVFTVDSIDTRVTGLSFTCWAGNSKTASGANIVATAYTSNSITLSSNPWAGSSPVVWTPTVPYVSTDATNYPNVIRFNLMGAWVASSATVNGDGTVTLNNVKGSDGTVNASISGVVGSQPTFISLAHSIGSAGFTNANTGIIFCDLRENQFWDHLWFNQVTRAFSFDATGSGGGASTGIGNAGFFSNIVVDQGQSFIWSAGDIFSAQIVNSQFYGTLIPLHSPSGSISSCNVSNCKVISGKFMYAGGNAVGNTFTGNSFNEITGYGYSDGLVSVVGTVQDCTIVGNNFGRSVNTVFATGNVLGTLFASNNIPSNGEGGAAYWWTCSGTILSSRFSGNNFGSQYSSNSNRLSTSSSSASLAGSVFGDDFMDKSNNTGPEIKSIGTWTPSLGGTATYTIQSGNYVKVGKLVTLRGKLVVNVIGTGSTTTVSGLPFPVDHTTNSVQFNGSVGYFSGLATPVVSLVPTATDLTSNVVFNGLAAAGTTMSASMGIFTSGTRVDFSITYQTP